MQKYISRLNATPFTCPTKNGIDLCRPIFSPFLPPTGPSWVPAICKERRGAAAFVVHGKQEGAACSSPTPSHNYSSAGNNTMWFGSSTYALTDKKSSNLHIVGLFLNRATVHETFSCSQSCPDVYVWLMAEDTTDIENTTNALHTTDGSKWWPISWSNPL